MRLRAEILLIHLALVALAPGEWCFWCFAAWRARLRTLLDNLNAAHDAH
jgi:hypothetical protein